MPKFKEKFEDSVAQSNNQKQQQFQDVQVKIKHKFQENFEDSATQSNNQKQQQFQDIQVKTKPNRPQHYADQKPIQLVKINNKGKIQVNQQALDILSQYQENIAFACLAGKYRTGKSFLLNKLINIKGKGFRVDPQVIACTQGIWIWSKPLYNQDNKTNIFFMDTQGTQSTNKDSTHDTKIFTLAMLICSYFMFNSVGAIDEQSLSQLNLVTQLSKNIIVSMKDNQKSLAMFTPKFLWILRDFTLKIYDQNQNPISAQEYLQKSIHQVHNKTNEKNKKIRKCLTQIFIDRDCITFVRPVFEENDLRKLDTLPQSKIRKQFMESLMELRAKIYNKCTPKQINGVNINSKLFNQMLLNYVEVINNGGVPNIQSAWEQIIEYAYINAHNDAIERYSYLIATKLQRSQPKPVDQLFKILIEMRTECLDLFGNATEVSEKDVFNKYRKKVNEFICDKQKQIIRINNQLCKSKSQQVLRNLGKQFKKKTESKIQSMDDVKRLSNIYQNFLKEYSQQSVGQNNCNILVQFLNSYNPILVKKIANSQMISGGSKKDKEEIEILKRQFQSRQAALQTKIIKMEQEKNEKQAIIRQMENKNKKIDKERLSATNQLKEREAKENEKKQKQCCIII